jgi:hypothetical protein
MARLPALQEASLGRERHGDSVTVTHSSDEGTVSLIVGGTQDSCASTTQCGGIHSGSRRRVARLLARIGGTITPAAGGEQFTHD